MSERTASSLAVPTAPDLGAAAPPVPRSLFAVCAVVLFEFLAMGIPLPVLPAHVGETLGLGAFAVGVAVGSQSWATLLTRHGAGTWSDRRGPRSAVRAGLIVSALAGAAYAAAFATSAATTSFAALLVGRALLGLGESLVVTGALAWGVGLAGRARSGLVMAWVGIAMYGAMGLGSLSGAGLLAHVGLSAIAAATAVAPLLGLAATWLAPDVPAIGGVRLPFYRVLGRIALPGAGLTLGALGFGAIAAFATLRFAERGWAHATWAMGAFGAAYVLARALFGGLPDRLGGPRAAAVAAGASALGQIALWAAPSGPTAIAAAALVGAGYALVFPSFGVDAVGRVPAQNRGAALGAYAACFDLAMGLGVPAFGLLASARGTGAVFAASAVGGGLSFAAALLLVARRRAAPAA